MMKGALLQGFGVGLRVELAREVLKSTRPIDWLEITPENWVGMGGERARVLDQCAERWTLVPHSVTMSIGGPDPLSTRLFDGVSALSKRGRVPFWSDHVCYSVLGGTHFNDLYPLPFHEESVEHLLSRIALAKAMTDVPLVFENPTFYAFMPGRTMDEATFLTTVLRESGCGMLLDVNNVYVNSQNHGFDPFAFVDLIPMDLVQQIHLAGHTRMPNVILDTHSGPVADPVWDLYRHTLRRAGRLIPTLLEWDAAVPALDVVLDEIDRAREHARTALAREAA